MEYIVLRGFQVDGYAALEVGESGILPYEADRIEALVAAGFLAPVVAEEEGGQAQGQPEPDTGEPAEMRPHFVGQGEPTPGTWEAVWRDAGAVKSDPAREE